MHTYTTDVYAKCSLGHNIYAGVIEVDAETDEEIRKAIIALLNSPRLIAICTICKSQVVAHTATYEIIS